MKATVLLAALFGVAPAFANSPGGLPVGAHDPLPTPHSSVCEQKCDVYFMQFYNACLAKGDTDCVAKARKLTGCGDFTCSMNCGYTAPGCVNPPTTVEVASAKVKSSNSSSCTRKSISTATVYVTISRPSLESSAIDAAVATMESKSALDPITVMITVTTPCSTALSSVPQKTSYTSSKNRTTAKSSALSVNATATSFLNATTSVVFNATSYLVHNATSTSASLTSLVFFDVSDLPLVTIPRVNPDVSTTDGLVPTGPWGNIPTYIITTDLVPNAPLGIPSGTVDGSSMTVSTDLSSDKATLSVEKRDQSSYPTFPTPGIDTDNGNITVAATATIKDSRIFGSAQDQDESINTGISIKEFTTLGLDFDSTLLPSPTHASTVPASAGNAPFSSGFLTTTGTVTWTATGTHPATTVTYTNIGQSFSRESVDTISRPGTWKSFTWPATTQTETTIGVQWSDGFPGSVWPVTTMTSTYAWMSGVDNPILTTTTFTWTLDSFLPSPTAPTPLINVTTAETITEMQHTSVSGMEATMHSKTTSTSDSSTTTSETATKTGNGAAFEAPTFALLAFICFALIAIL